MPAGAASHLGGQARLLNSVKSLGNRTSVTYGTTVTVVWGGFTFIEANMC